MFRRRDLLVKIMVVILALALVVPLVAVFFS